MSSVRSTSDGGGPVTHKSSGKGGGNLARTPDVAVVISLKLVYTPVDDTVTATLGIDVAGMDSIRVDKQGWMVGEGNGSKNGEAGNNTRNSQRTEGRVSSAGRHQGGWPRHPKKGATVEAETGHAGDGPSHGRTYWQRTNWRGELGGSVDARPYRHSGRRSRKWQ